MLYYPDFNKFYEKNRTEIDKYIWSTAWKYQHILEAEDMFQEIVLRLARSTFLRDWNEKKAALNTYFTNRVRGYALHIITKILRQLCVKKLKDGELPTEPPVSFLRLDSHEFSEWPLGTPGYDFTSGRHNFEISEDPTEEEEMFFKEIIGLFKDKVTPLQVKIFKMHYWSDFTYHEIGAILNRSKGTFYSYNFIRNKNALATDIMLNILSSEGVKSGK